MPAIDPSGCATTGGSAAAGLLLATSGFGGATHRDRAP